MKAFDLTEAKLPQGFVVVGLKIDLIRGENYRHERVALALHAARLDFESGKIPVDDFHILELHRSRPSRFLFKFRHYMILL